MDKENEEETNHRRNIPFFGSMMSSIKRRGGGGSPGGGPGSGPGGGAPGGVPSVTLNVNSVHHAKISPTGAAAGADYAATAQQNSFRKIPDE